MQAHKFFDKVPSVTLKCQIKHYKHSHGLKMDLHLHKKKFSFHVEGESNLI